MALPLFYWLLITAINQRFRMIPESTRCTVYMLSQILYYKTIDVGKTSALLILLVAPLSYCETGFLISNWIFLSACYTTPNHFPTAEVIDKKISLFKILYLSRGNFVDPPGTHQW